MINEQTIEQVREAAAGNIVHIISDYVRLKKVGGGTYHGLCPFHSERTPSFSVSKPKGIYKCFGCGQFGDPIDFIMKHDKASFIDAVKYIADKYNIAIDESTAPGAGSPRRLSKPKETGPEYIAYIPDEYLDMCCQSYEFNSFAVGLTAAFGPTLCKRAIEKYMIGTSKLFYKAGYYSVVFPQIDKDIQFRQCNIILYDTATLKRVKKNVEGVRRFDKYAGQYVDMQPGDQCARKYGKELDPRLKGDNITLQCCFFGEHLLSIHPNKPVRIVESEKTAIICDIFYPQFIWLATAGSTGVRWAERQFCEVLQGRTVKLYPDASKYREWNERAAIIAGLVSCDISVSALIEHSATADERAAGLDLADYLFNRCHETGLVLTDQGYPAMWDL